MSGTMIFSGSIAAKECIEIVVGRIGVRGRKINLVRSIYKGTLVVTPGETMLLRSVPCPEKAK